MADWAIWIEMQCLWLGNLHSNQAVHRHFRAKWTIHVTRQGDHVKSEDRHPALFSFNI